MKNSKDVIIILTRIKAERAARREKTEKAVLTRRSTLIQESKNNGSILSFIVHALISFIISIISTDTNTMQIASIKYRVIFVGIVPPSI